MKAVLYMPDGNRRFAKKNNISFSEAYNFGAKTLKLFSDFFVSEGVSNMLIYHAMSDYTHQRTDLTLEPIYDAITECFRELYESNFFIKRKIKFKTIDHSKAVPERLKNISKRLEDSTNSNSKEVVVLLGYSLEEDYNCALSKNPKNYNELRKWLLFPDIDLVIRPKEMRPSKGPVYAMGQSQMITLDKLNPEVEENDLSKILEECSLWKGYRERNNPFHKQ